MRNVLRDWMGKATPAEKRQLAELANTTLSSLRQAAGGYKHDGGLDLGSDLAGRIEVGTLALARRGLPALRREQMCGTCRSCPRTCKP